MDLITEIKDNSGKLKGQILVCKFNPNKDEDFNPPCPNSVFTIYFNKFEDKKGKTVISNVTYNILSDTNKRFGIASVGKLWNKIGHLVTCQWIEKTIKLSDALQSKVTAKDLEREFAFSDKPSKKTTKKSKAGFKFDGLNDQQLQSLLTQLLQEREKANG
jgi:hypothetical protein|tara:strand:- start:155 stop:634 length:480 start_codon:yes stop_codon:yes gene_type:complete